MKRFGTFNVVLRMISNVTGTTITKTTQDTFAYANMADAETYFSSARYLERVLATKIPVQLRRHIRLEVAAVAHV